MDSKSTASKHLFTCSRISLLSFIYCKVSCFNNVAGFLYWYILSNLSHTSLKVPQPLIFFNSEEPVYKMISNLALLSFFETKSPAFSVFHLRTARYYSLLTVPPFLFSKCLIYLYSDIKFLIYLHNSFLIIKLFDYKLII